MSEWKELPTLQSVAQAQADGWEIEGLCGLLQGWIKWNGTSWHENWEYRGRPKQTKRILTSECWRQKTTGAILWRKPGTSRLDYTWERFPAGDTTGEV